MELALSEMDNEKGEGRWQQLVDIAIRYAMKLDRGALAGELADKTRTRV